MLEEGVSVILGGDYTRLIGDAQRKHTCLAQQCDQDTHKPQMLHVPGHGPGGNAPDNPTAICHVFLWVDDASLRQGQLSASYISIWNSLQSP